MRQSFHRLAVLLLLFAGLLPSRPASAQSRRAVAFINAHVIPLDNDTLLPNHTVLVQNGRIAAIGPTSGMALPRGVRQIDAAGRFLLPGLIELRGHVPHPDDVDRESDRLHVYLARGVTAMRGVRTHESQLKLQQRLNRDDMVGPRLFFAAGDSLSTEKPFFVLRELRARADAASGDYETPYAQLRRITVEAARTLGIDAESGTITVGKRADLVLLDANPLEDARNARLVFGVMVHGRWLPHAETAHKLEERVKDAIFDYYIRIPRNLAPTSECRGLTLYECFDGDSECAAEQSCNIKYLRRDRAKLIERLDLFGEGDWRSDLIVGQRVNFALKDSLFEQAFAIAESCEASPWWCQALRGYALHMRRAGDGWRQLDSAWVNAPGGQLAWATPRIRAAGDRGLGCEWSDLSTLMNRSMRSEYNRLPCGLNRAFEAQFWWLADPLWSKPGNERRAEQFARNIAMRLHDEILRIRNRENFHPRTHHNVVMPAGIPNSYRTTISYNSRTRASGSRRELYVYGGYSFVPDAERFREPMKSTSADWALKFDDGNERMVTREKWYNLEHQTAVLHRSGRQVVLAAATLPLLLPTYDGIEAFLALGRPSDRHVEIVPAKLEPSSILRASTELGDGEWMASIEVVADTFRARARHGAPAPTLTNGFGVSDLVLVHERFERERMPLLDAMLPTSSLIGRNRVGVYFEVYGVRADETLRIALSGTAINRSIVERLADAVGLTQDAPLNVAWLEPAETTAGNVMRRFLEVDLTSLENGDNRLLITVVRADGTTATGQRDISLLRER